MDSDELVSYYLKKSQDWIFIPQFRHVKIDDDEILDLDSMNLDSNEDTWLYSSTEKSILKDTEKSMECEELEKEFISNNETESKKEKLDVTDSPLSPLLGPEDFQHPSFLNSIDEMSETAIEDLLRTPLSSRSKATLLQKALSNSQSFGELNSTLNNVSKLRSQLQHQLHQPLKEAVGNDDDDDVVIDEFKKPAAVATSAVPVASDSVARSYVLHSVENKLFNLADANAAELKTHDLRNAEIARKMAASAVDKVSQHDDLDALRRRFADMKTDGGGVGAVDDGGNDENALNTAKPTFAWHSTPHHDNVHKVRRSFPQQPTPILLNRYLKHRLQAETNAVHAGGDSERTGQVDTMTSPECNEMNVSYVKYETSANSAKLPRIENGSADDCPAESRINSIFSKSDDVLNSSCNELNSTYNLAIEDDVASSASESSLSSLSNKHTLSLREVQKMADLQEQSLKKQVYSSYYAGSSKSSEVSSSSESVSTYGALSNSNEGSIDIQPPSKIMPGIQPPKQRLSYAKNPQPVYGGRTNSHISTYDRTNVRSNFQASKLGINVGGKSNLVTQSESKSSIAYRSKVSMANGQFLNGSHSPNRKSAPLTRPSTVPLKPTTVIEKPNEFVSVNEIKNVCSVKTNNNAGPASHIPRPASKIPMFRSSSSCNRYSKS